MVHIRIFMTTGCTTHPYAGPTVIVSYAIVDLCPLLSAFYYTVFAGDAFSYLRITFDPSSSNAIAASLWVRLVRRCASVIVESPMVVADGCRGCVGCAGRAT